MDLDITRYIPFIEKCFYPKKYTLGAIEGGLSYDVKLKADVNGESYIVKIVEGKCPRPPYKANRIVFYQALCRANELDKRIVCPQWYAYIDNRVVTITKWLHGVSLEEYLYQNPNEKIAYGKQAGKLLYNLHHFDFIKSGIEKSGERFVPKLIKKTDGLIETVKRLNIGFEGIEKVIAYLQENKNVLSEERTGILHNDVRLENFMINNGEISLFDFDSGTISDCYAEFAYLTALADKDFRVFAYAVIKSYFNGNVPDDFWAANLYFCMIKLLEYAVYKFNKSGKAVVNQAKSCMEIFNGYKEAVPNWWNKIDGQYGKEFIFEDEND